MVASPSAEAVLVDVGVIAEAEPPLEVVAAGGVAETVVAAPEAVTVVMEPAPQVEVVPKAVSVVAEPSVVEAAVVP
ncbi:MAG: hypothetical protein ACKO85_03960, partial [Isosphaeraceae bacterium]